MPADLLRIYDPAECDPEGVPSRWAELRAYVLALVAEAEHAAEADILPRAPWRDPAAPALNPPSTGGTVRCEDCGHPMSNVGTWENGPVNPTHMKHTVPLMLRAGREPKFIDEDGGTFRPAYYSPCDEGCHHGGPGRWRFGDNQLWALAELGANADGEPAYSVLDDRRDAGADIEASWRQVDVRTLGWPHDLRPERLAILCLRCWSGRSNDAR